MESACKISYFRGQLAGRLREETNASPEAMMSVNLTRDQVKDYVTGILSPDAAESITVACVNSPSNCTLSGPEAALDTLKIQLDDDEIFAQKLKTGVAYHSSYMSRIATEYLSLISSLDVGEVTKIPMVSSVTGKVILPSKLSQSQYWVDNMVCPVEFSQAIYTLTRRTQTLKVGMEAITDLVEVGPHSALRRPVLDSIGQEAGTKKQLRYFSTLNRSKSALRSILELLGNLFCHGHDVAIPIANQQLRDKLPRPFLIDCPSYPFDHSRVYWQESRMSRDYRLRKTVHGDVLGQCSPEWNHLEPRWRSFLSTETIPWTKDHMVSEPPTLWLGEILT